MKAPFNSRYRESNFKEAPYASLSHAADVPAKISRINIAKILIVLFFIVFAINAATRSSSSQIRTPPSDAGTPSPRQDGNATSGRDVFRFETFDPDQGGYQLKHREPCTAPRNPPEILFHSGIVPLLLLTK